MKIHRYFLTVCFLLVGPAAQAFNLEKTIAYIECEATDAQGVKIKTTGSGVVVSARGHVLTARHVAPVGTNCRASLGVADPNNSGRLVHRPLSVGGYDVALLQLSTADTPDFLRYCPLSDAMIRKPIFTAGFPLGTSTGKPSFRAGIMSTTFLTADGYVETDSLTATGMSGGPVLADDEKSLIGIVSGANFMPDGTPKFYGITPIVGIQASQLDLQRNEAGCYVPKPTTQELLAEIEALKGALSQSKADLEALMTEKTGALAVQLTQKATELEAQISDETGTLETKLSKRAGDLEVQLGKNKAELKRHKDTLALHKIDIEKMEDHPERLESAEGTLSEVEANIEWSASIVGDTGSMRVGYKKIVSSGGGIDKIGLIVTGFLNRKREDRSEGFLTTEDTLIFINPDDGRTLDAEPSASKLGGDFQVSSLIAKKFIDGRYDLNESTFHPDHPLTKLKLRVIPIGEGVAGTPVDLEVRLPQDQWAYIYSKYLEAKRAGNGS